MKALSSIPSPPLNLGAQSSDLAMERQVKLAEQTHLKHRGPKEDLPRRLGGLREREIRGEEENVTRFYKMAGTPFCKIA